MNSKRPVLLYITCIFLFCFITLNFGFRVSGPTAFSSRFGFGGIPGGDIHGGGSEIGSAGGLERGAAGGWGCFWGLLGRIFCFLGGLCVAALHSHVDVVDGADHCALKLALKLLLIDNGCRWLI